MPRTRPFYQPTEGVGEFRRRMKAMKPYDPNDHLHIPGDGSWWEYDARGIEIARVCAICKPHKLAGYRKEVLRNPNYEADEPIDEE